MEARHSDLSGLRLRDLVVELEKVFSFSRLVSRHLLCSRGQERALLLHESRAFGPGQCVAIVRGIYVHMGLEESGMTEGHRPLKPLLRELHEMCDLNRIPDYVCHDVMFGKHDLPPDRDPMNAPVVVRCGRVVRAILEHLKEGDDARDKSETSTGLL